MSDRKRRHGRRAGMAAWLIRGPDAAHIVDDLEELRARDVASGLSPTRVRWRYARNLLASSLSVARARLRWPRFPGVSVLDLKLAARLLVKQPGLTLVGCFALAVGIPIALAPMQLVWAINGPLPFPQAERILGLKFWDRTAGDDRLARLDDFELWQRELRSFERLGASRPSRRNVVNEDGRVEVVRGSEVTASTFDILRVQPQHGRLLLASDEVAGTTPVVLISHELWQTRFGGDPSVVGRTVQLSGARHTVVGVMQAGFAFPVLERYWIPLQARAIDYELGAAPTVQVYGRLRAGFDRRAAQAELTAVGHRLARENPERYRHMRLDVLPVAHALSGLRPEPGRVWPIFVMTLLLLGVACGNVGTLMLARTAARSSEIAVRTALGAGRGRIVAQLFVEALVLSVLAAAIGLAIGELLVAQRFEKSVTVLPFWFDLSLRPRSIVYAGGLVVFSALVAGLIPAIRATGRNVFRSLQRVGAGGSGLRFGAVSSLLIVSEVAIAVGCLSVVGMVAGSMSRDLAPAEGLAADEYLAAELAFAIEPPTKASAATHDSLLSARLRVTNEEIVQRLRAEPGVRAVTFASVLPGMDHAGGGVEVDGIAARADGEYNVVRRAWVDVQFFQTLQQPTLAGRGFETGDLKPSGRPVLVNRSFVHNVLHDQNAVGRRIRFPGRPQDPPAPWLEIVGVVNDLGMNAANPAKGAGVYHPIAPGQLHPIQLLLHATGEPTALIPRVRSIVTTVEPTLMVTEAALLDDVISEMLWQARFTGFVFILIAAIAVVLSAAGLYALMSFTVSERTREIGIRTALGARPRRIIGVVVTRALLQLGAGVIAGAWLGTTLVSQVINDANRAPNWSEVLGAVAAVMLVIGLLACALPTRRALRIEPLDALRERG